MKICDLVFIDLQNLNMKSVFWFWPPVGESGGTFSKKNAKKTDMVLVFAIYNIVHFKFVVQNFIGIVSFIFWKIQDNPTTVAYTLPTT